MRVKEKLFGALLLSCASGAIAERCRTPPKLVVADSKYECSPPSTAMPPVGTVVLELTVMTDGTVRDVLVIEPVDSRLRRWAIEDSKHLTFEPVGKACRARLTLESRISGGAGGAQRIESTQTAHPNCRAMNLWPARSPSYGGKEPQQSLPGLRVEFRMVR